LLISYLSEHADAGETMSLVEAEGRKAILVPGDIQEAAHCRAIVDRAIAELGAIDILLTMQLTRPRSRIFRRSRTTNGN
jgi:hypothetical protein